MFECKTINDLKDCKEDIVIFGTGIIGKRVLNFFYRNDIYVKEFCDNNKEVQNTVITTDYYIKKKISSLESIKENDVKRDVNSDNKIFIIANKLEKHVNSIKNQLKENGYHNILTINDLFNIITPDVDIFPVEKLSFFPPVYFLEKNKENSKTLHSFQMQITERCTLKCKNCANFMQYYKEPADYEVDEINTYVDKMADIFDRILRVSFIGGEPFFHKGWFDIIDNACKKPNISLIALVTNSTIIPNEEYLAKLDNSKVIVTISDYESHFKNNNENIKKLSRILEKYKICYTIPSLGTWDNITVRNNANLPEDKIIEYYSNCKIKDGCNMIIKGKYFACPQAANMHNLNMIPEEMSSYIDIMDTSISNEELAEKIVDFSRHNDYVTECQYCTKAVPENAHQEIPIAEQIKKPLEYKKFL